MITLSQRELKKKKKPHQLVLPVHEAMLAWLATPVRVKNSSGLARDGRGEKVVLTLGTE